MYTFPYILNDHFQCEVMTLALTNWSLQALLFEHIQKEEKQKAAIFYIHIYHLSLTHEQNM